MLAGDSGTVKIVPGGVDPKPIVVSGSVNEDKEKLIKEALQNPASLTTIIIHVRTEKK
ncbi:MAG: hypothetical protein ACHQK8_09000 [Bacteroidia bacterium]